jgi:hypothetical protein
MLTCTDPTETSPLRLSCTKNNDIPMQHMGELTDLGQDLRLQCKLEYLLVQPTILQGKIDNVAPGFATRDRSPVIVVTFGFR